MSQFIGQLLLRSLSIQELDRAGSPSKQLYQLVEDFGYESSKLGFNITAPAGLITDFASIPRPVWSILDPEDPIIAWGSVIHDVLYKQQGLMPGGRVVTREQADSVLREAMELQGAGNFLRSAVYWGLRAGGSHAWNNPTSYKITP